jgi:uncharacterized protein (DUF433 family)
MNMKLEDHIEINQQIRFGKPIIKGTRISVYEILNWLANDMSKEEILDDFPELKLTDIQACLLYAPTTERILSCGRI